MKQGWKKLVIGAATASALVVGGGASAATGAAPSDWPTEGHDAAQSRYNSGESTITSSTVSSLHFLRKFNGRSPVVVGNVIYMLTGTRTSAKAAAYNLSTGARIWSSAIAGTPVDTNVLQVSNGAAYVSYTTGESESDPAGGIVAFTASNGSRRWVERTGGVFSFTVSGDRIVYPSPSAVGGVYGLATSDGHVVWTTEDLEEGSSNPVVTRGGVIVSASDSDGNYLRSVSVADGTELWRIDGDYESPRGDAAGRDLYVRGPRNDLLTDLNPATGAFKWSAYAYGTAQANAYAVGRNRVFVSCDNGALCALARTDGTRVWKAAVSPDNVAVAADLLYPAPGDSPRLVSAGTAVPTRGYPAADDTFISGGRLIAINGSAVGVYGP